MKHIYLLFLLLVIGIFACNKKDDPKQTYNYHVEGIKDMALVKGSHTIAATPTMVLDVAYDQNARERVAITLENVPAGLYYRIDSAVGTPSFRSNIHFADSGVSEGYYNIKLIATGASSGRREFGFTMIVSSQPDCTADITGSNFTTTSPCSPIANYMQNVVAVSGYKNRIIFSNIDNGRTNIYANIDCELGALTIPQQVLYGCTYEGSGGFTNSGTQRIISFTLKMTRPSGTIDSCNYRLVK